MNYFDKRIEELNQEINDTKKEINALNERIKNIRGEISEQIKLKNKEKMENRKCYFCGSETYYAKGLCRNCYNRKRKSGTVEYKQKKVRELKEKKQKPMWYDRLYKDVFGENVFDDGYCKPEDYLESICTVYETLTPREQEAMEMRYEGEATYLEIGNSFGVTLERARQIVKKALRKMRHPTRKEVLEFGKSGTEERHRKQEEEASRLVEEAQKERDARLKDAYKSGTADIQYYDLNVRSYNLLKRSNLNTPDEVIKFIVENGSIMQLRNCGRKSAEDIYKNLFIPEELWI